MLKPSLLLASAALAVIAAGCANDADQPDAYGSFEATEVTVSSMANGRIMRFDVEEGQMIDSGTIVGYVDTIDLHLKKRQGIDSRNATGSRSDDLKAQIEVQEQNRRNILVEKARVERLLKDGAATSKQLDDINASLNVVDKQILSLQSHFRGIGDQVGSAGMQIAQV